jgi:hypothetical protein
MTTITTDLHEATRLTRAQAANTAEQIQKDDDDCTYEPMGLADTDQAVIEVYDEDGDFLGYL